MADIGNLILEEIGGRIRDLRKQRDWTIECLAFEAKLSASQISEIERGLRDAQISTYKKIADAFGISLAVLLSSDSNGEKIEDELMEIHKKIEYMDSYKKAKFLESLKYIVFIRLD